MVQQLVDVQTGDYVHNWSVENCLNFETVAGREHTRNMGLPKHAADAAIIQQDDCDEKTKVDAVRSKYALFA